MLSACPQHALVQIFTCGVPPCCTKLLTGKRSKDGASSKGDTPTDAPRWHLNEPFASVPGLPWLLDNLFEPPPLERPAADLEAGDYSEEEEDEEDEEDEVDETHGGGATRPPLPPPTTCADAGERASSPMNGRAASCHFDPATEKLLACAEGSTSAADAAACASVPMLTIPSPHPSARGAYSGGSGRWHSGGRITPCSEGLSPASAPNRQCACSRAGGATDAAGVALVAYADAVAAVDADVRAAGADTGGALVACSRDDSKRIVSISVSQWGEVPPSEADWVRVHGLLSDGEDAEAGARSDTDGERPREASPPRLVEIDETGSAPDAAKAGGLAGSSGGGGDALAAAGRTRTASTRPTPAELFASANKKGERPTRKSPPRPKGPPPVVRMQRRLLSPHRPRWRPEGPPPPPPPPLPSYAGATPRQLSPRKRDSARRFGRLPSERADACPARAAPIVCFTNRRVASVAPAPAQLEPHMQLPQRIHFFLRTHVTSRVTYPFDKRYPESQYLLTATVQPGYEHAGPTFALDDDVIKRHVIGSATWPSAEPFLTGEHHLELVVPSTERINPGVQPTTMKVNAGNQRHRGDSRHEKPPPLQHTMASALARDNEVPRINVPVTPKPLRPSMRVRNVFAELSHARVADGQRVMPIASLPLALEALGGVLTSWEARTALELAHGWARLGKDGTLDLFEFAQAAKELETTKPPPSAGGRSSRAASQGARDWRYGTPYRDGVAAKKQMFVDYEGEAMATARGEADSDESDDEDGATSQLSSRLQPHKKLVGRPLAMEPPPVSSPRKALTTSAGGSESGGGERGAAASPPRSDSAPSPPDVLPLPTTASGAAFVSDASLSVRDRIHGLEHGAGSQGATGAPTSSLPGAPPAPQLQGRLVDMGLGVGANEPATGDKWRELPDLAQARAAQLGSPHAPSDLLSGLARTKPFDL